MFGFIRNLIGNGNVEETSTTTAVVDTPVVPVLPVVRNYNNSDTFYNAELNQSFSFGEMINWAREFYISALPYGHGIPFLRTIAEYSQMYQESKDEYVLGLLNAHLLVWDRVENR